MYSINTLIGNKCILFLKGVIRLFVIYIKGLVFIMPHFIFRELLFHNATFIYLMPRLLNSAKFIYLMPHLFYNATFPSGILKYLGRSYLRPKH